ncbi:MAG TPA: SpoIIE family protein phosphatase [Nocardioidaceae bacterium]|nr:SpoIIE family protein phosphatase [Nocardioidaceae bacterium]
MPDGQAGTGTDEAKVVGFAQHPLISLVCEGPDTRVIAISDGFSALRESTESVIGIPLRESFGELMGQQVIERLEECYRTGRPQVQREWRVEVEIPESGMTELYYDFMLSPWRGPDGTIRGVVAAGADVSAQVLARREAEQRQKRSERRYLAAQEVVVTLQDALLPAELPVVPGVDLGARYLLAADDTAAGGDWFDAVVRPDGRVALVVGDVVGHGVAASAVMGQLRAVLHERLVSGTSIEAALRDLDRFASLRHESRAATVCVAELEPHTGEVGYCTAGHPPPLVVTAAGEAHYLEGSGDGPLATGSGFHVRSHRLAADELLLLYSDGLVERPDRSAAQSTVEIAQVVGDAYLGQNFTQTARRTVDRVCELGLELLTRLTGYSDDITVIAAQRVPKIAPLQISLAAEPAAIGRVRSQVADWLDPIEVRSLDQMTVQHAIGELGTNVVEHAYHDGHGEVEVRVELDERGYLVATVADGGKWVKPSGSDGRGLGMVGGLVDEFSLDHADTGTTARVRHRLSRPALLLTGAGPATQAHGTLPVEADFDIGVDAASGTLTVQGAIDSVNADRLRAALLEASGGGTKALDVELSQVTLLASAGVRVLHELRSGNLGLFAAPGSPAQQVLELVNLPYQAATLRTDGK